MFGFLAPIASAIGGIFSGGISSGVGSVIGGALGAIGQHKTNQSNEDISSANNAFNAEQAGLNREFQDKQAEIARTFNREEATAQRAYEEQMYNTRYQRQAEDLRRAGINPLLSVQQSPPGPPSGASASTSPPSGSQASSAGLPRMGNVIGAAVNSAQTALQIKNADAQNELLQAQAFRERAEGWAAMNKPAQMEAQTRRDASQVGVNQTLERLNVTSADKAAAETNNVKIMSEYLNEQIRNIKQQTKTEEQRTNLTNAQYHLTRAEELYTAGKIGIQEYTKAIEMAEAQIRNSMVQGSYEEQKFQSVFGQLQRLLKMASPFK